VFLANAVKLFQGAAALGVPVLLTVQYVKGLGPTVEAIKAVTAGAPELEKRCFSAWDDPAIREAIRKSGKKTVAVSGAETHVCILQTCIDLIAAGYTVAVVADCVTSRTAFNRDMGIERLREEGVVVTTYESVLFELTRTSTHPNFREISRIIK
jgi:nicotinamidase-related amidase